MKVEAIKCKDCGRIGLSVDDKRITPHKCSGQWTTIATAEASSAWSRAWHACAARYRNRYECANAKAAMWAERMHSAEALVRELELRPPVSEYAARLRERDGAREREASAESRLAAVERERDNAISGKVHAVLELGIVKSKLAAAKRELERWDQVGWALCTSDPEDDRRHACPGVALVMARHVSAAKDRAERELAEVRSQICAARRKT